MTIGRQEGQYMADLSGVGGLEQFQGKMAGFLGGGVWNESGAGWSFPTVSLGYRASSRLAWIT